MANFKRKGPKSTRSGCLLCKPHKDQVNKSAERTRQKRQWKSAAESGDSLTKHHRL